MNSSTFQTLDGSIENGEKGKSHRCNQCDHASSNSSPPGSWPATSARQSPTSAALSSWKLFFVEESLFLQRPATQRNTLRFIFSYYYFSGDKCINIYIEQHREVPSGLYFLALIFKEINVLIFILINTALRSTLIILPVLTEKSNKIG